MAKKGESMRTRSRMMGEGTGIFLEVNQKVIRRCEFEVIKGRCWCHVGKINVAGTTYGSRVANIMLRDGV